MDAELIRAHAVRQWIESKGVDLSTPGWVRTLGRDAVMEYQYELTRQIRHDPNQVLDGHPNEP